jgi:COP9 signalosome complex subunit 4
LSPAGDSKFRLLSVLHKDERSSQIDPHFDLLDKFYNGHVIKSSNTEAFIKGLEDHQQARGQDGYSVLERAVLEHNILAVSKIYLNISFEQLGKFLDILPQKAEHIICNMVTENRIRASLDQLSGTIDFDI